MKTNLNKNSIFLSHMLNWLPKLNCISFKLLTVVLAALFLLVFKNVYWGYWKELDTNKEQIYKNFALIANVLENDITRWLENRENEVEAMAENPLVRQYISEIVQGSPNSNKAAAALEQYWKKISKIYGIYDEIYLVNGAGLVLVSTDPDHKNTFRPRDDLIIRPLETGHIYLKDAYLSNRTKKPCIAFSIPVNVLNEGNSNYTDNTAILVYRIDIGSVIQPLLESRVNLGDTGEVMLINRESTVITELRSQPGSALNYKLNSETALRVARGEEGISQDIGYTGQEILAVYRYLPKMQWGLIIRQETREIFGPLRAQMFNSLVTSTFIVIFVLGLLYLLLRRVMKPVSIMAGAAQDISRGNFTRRVNVNSNDEIGKLGQALNILAQELGHQFKLQKNTEGVLKVLVSTLDLDKLLVNSLSTVCNSFKFKVGAVFLVDRKNGLLVRKALYCPGQELEQRETLKLGEGLESFAAMTGRVQVIDLTEDTCYTINWLGGNILPASIVVVPLVFGSEVLGVMSLASLIKVDEREAGELETIGALVGVAINNSFLYVRTRELSARLQEANEQLAQQNEELSAQGEELTAQAEELQVQAEELQASTRELQQKNIELERMGEQKTKFFAFLSHELRAPLNAVISFSDMLLDRVVGELNRQQEKYLQEILNSGQHLLNLINDLLDLSKLEIGKIELNMKEIDPSIPLEEAIAMVSAGATQKNLQLTNMVAPNSFSVYADPVRLKQIFLNLITNAVKFTPEGGRITIGARKDKDKLVFWVSDTGIGIPRDFLELIFEEFKQAGNVVAGMYGGTGLGLAITKKLVQLHGGSIFVESDEGRGATFTFILPTVSGKGNFIAALPECRIKCTQQGDGASSNCPRASVTYLPKPLVKSVLLEQLNRINCLWLDSTQTVLVVDDDPAVRNYVEGILQPRGYRVIEAENGLEGIELALREKPDIIILDISMPGADGFGVVEAISKQCWEKGLSVFICTSKDLSVKEKQFLEARIKDVYKGTGQTPTA